MQSRRVPSHAPDTYPRSSRGAWARLRYYRTCRLDRHVQLLTELARLSRQAPGAKQTLPRIFQGPRPPELSIRRVAYDPVLRRVSLIRSGIISRVCAAHQGVALMAIGRAAEQRDEVAPFHIRRCLLNVRFVPESGPRRLITACRSSANSGLLERSKTVCEGPSPEKPMHNAQGRSWKVLRRWWISINRQPAAKDR